MNEYRKFPSMNEMRHLLLGFGLLPSLLLAQSPAPVSVPADFAAPVVEATFKLGSGAIGTGFLVHRELPDRALYFVTVGHAFDDNTSETNLITLRKRKADGSYERQEQKISLRREGKPLWVRNAKHDVAVLRISEPLPVEVPSLPASALADEAGLKASGAHVCSPLFVLGYPQGLEADQSGLPVARQGIFSSSPQLPLTTHPTFLADYNAFKGDSGGPVFIETTDRRPLIVGIVTEQHYFYYDMAGPDEKHSVQIPLRVAKVLHAQYVRETLELAAKGGG